MSDKVPSKLDMLLQNPVAIQVLLNCVTSRPVALRDPQYGMLVNLAMALEEELKLQNNDTNKEKPNATV